MSGPATGYAVSDARIAPVGPNDVVSSGGAILGTVVDVIIETGADPKAVGYEVQTSSGSVFVPSSAQMSISGTNLVVPADAEGFVRNDLVGFGAAVESFHSLIATGGAS